MADNFSQWLCSSSSTTLTYDDIRGSFAVPPNTMPRLPNSNWAPPPAPRGNTRGCSSSAQSRGGRQGEYWRQPDLSRVDIYAAVDSWRSYSNDANTLQSSLTSQPHTNVSFDPYSQVFEAQAHGHPNNIHIQNPPQTTPYRNRSNVCYPNLGLPQTQNYQQQHSSTAPQPPSAQWPQYGESQAGAAPAHFTPYEPMRFSNGLQERQRVYQSAGASWRGNSQPTFSQQIPMRPNRGAEGSRGYTSTRDQPIASIEQGHALPIRRGTDYRSSQRDFPRRSTPRRHYAPTPPPPSPVARQAYLAQAHLLPERLKEPQRLLVILDLNGTLMLKPDYRKPKDFHVRPGAYKLLEYLFANHTVMVYTSGQPHNAEIVARGLFSAAQYDELAAIWARDKLDLTPVQYRAKVQVYKKLDKIWANNEIQSSFFPPGTGKWDQTNTILVDDSHLKALQEPHNLLQVPEFTGKQNELKKNDYVKREEQICQSLVMKLEVLKWQNDVSRLIWRWQTGKADIPRVPGSNVFVDEKIDQKEQAKKDLEAAMNLPTPESPVTTDSEKSEDESDSVLPPRNVEASITPERTDSESPVTEAVFKGLLATSGGNAKSDMPTPDSETG